MNEIILLYLLTRLEVEVHRHARNAKLYRQGTLARSTVSLIFSHIFLLLSHVLSPPTSTVASEAALPPRRVIKRKTVLMYRALLKALKHHDIESMRRVLKQHQPETPSLPSHDSLATSTSSSSPSSSFNSLLHHYIHTHRTGAITAIKLIPTDQLIQFRLSAEEKERMNGILKQFVGVKSYHNHCILYVLTPNHIIQPLHIFSTTTK